MPTKEYHATNLDELLKYATILYKEKKSEVAVIKVDFPFFLVPELNTSDLLSATFKGYFSPVGFSLRQTNNNTNKKKILGDPIIHKYCEINFLDPSV